MTTARDVLVNNAGISLDSKLPNSAGVEASAVCVRQTSRDCRGDGPVPAGNGNHLGRAGSAPPILLGGFIVVVARRSLRCALHGSSKSPGSGEDLSPFWRRLAADRPPVPLASR